MHIVVVVRRRLSSVVVSRRPKTMKRCSWAKPPRRHSRTRADARRDTSRFNPIPPKRTWTPTESKSHCPFIPFSPHPSSHPLPYGSPIWKYIHKKYKVWLPRINCTSIQIYTIFLYIYIYIYI